MASDRISSAHHAVTAGPDIGRLDDKVALITGASSGLGRAIAIAYAAAGCYVVCADLTPDPPVTLTGAGVASRLSAGIETTTSTVDLINKTFVDAGDYRARAMYAPCDVSDSDSVQAAVAQAVKQYDRLDIMVNNAGLNAVTKSASFRSGHTCRIHETDDAVFHKDATVNVFGVWLGIKHAVRQMLAQKPHQSGDRGWIINMSSSSGLAASPGVASYCTSKAACYMLTKAAALDYAPDRIHVNCINPGFVDTPLIDSFLIQESAGDAVEKMDQLRAAYPWGRVGMPEEVARMAVFLAGPGASFCTGAAYRVDGGLTAQ